jgi:hypothetical protein
MSLTSFIERPRIKAAFASHATPQRTPQAVRGAPVLAPSSGKLQGIVGAAFDYLVRLHLVRVLRGSQVQLIPERVWAAETGIARLPRLPVLPKDARRWCALVEEARAEADAFVAGKGELARLALATQNLANAEVLLRRPEHFDATFLPLPELADELLRLIELFAQQDWITPVRLCILNPIFAAHQSVGGADADIVLDASLIDLKVVGRLETKQELMIQLAGYAALNRMGGIALDEGVHDEPFESVAFYFARHGKLVSWTIEEMFPGDGFNAFCTEFEAEVGSSHREHTK